MTDPAATDWKYLHQQLWIARQSQFVFLRQFLCDTFFFFYNTRFNWTASTLVLFLYKLWLHVTVKSPSCRNYITVCGGFSEFWMQVGNVNFCLCSQTHVPFYNKQIADSTSFTCKLLANWCHLNALKLPWKWQLTATISKATAPCQWLCSLTWL